MEARMRVIRAREVSCKLSHNRALDSRLLGTVLVRHLLVMLKDESNCPHKHIPSYGRPLQKFQEAPTGDSYDDHTVFVQNNLSLGGLLPRQRCASYTKT